MIYYLAGSPSGKLGSQRADRAHARNFLFTFAHSTTRQCAELFCQQPHRRIFVDSGAWSAWKQGVRIDLTKYIDFCKKIMGMAKCPVVFAALDVIPGVKDGPKPTEDEIGKTCEEGWKNYLTMKQEGISPLLMTYHQFEHKRYLERIAGDSDYFAVAPRKRGVTDEEKQIFLGHVFGYLKQKGWTRKKRVHGLGIASNVFMEQFPFYSIDNTAWLNSQTAHSRAHLAGTKTGFRTEYKTLRDWEKLAWRDGVDTTLLREMLGYESPGVKPDPEGRSGAYWLMYLAMGCAVETECRITELWRRKGVDWGDHPTHDERLPSLVTLCGGNFYFLGD